MPKNLYFKQKKKHLMWRLCEIARENAKPVTISWDLGVENPCQKECVCTSIRRTHNKVSSALNDMTASC